MPYLARTWSWALMISCRWENDWLRASREHAGKWLLNRTSFFQDCKALISLSFIESECRLLGTVGVDGEEFEGAALDRGWPGVEGKEVFLVERGGRLDPAVCGEIGE